MVDSFELFKGLYHVYKGLHLLCFALEKLGVIIDPISQYDESGEKFENIRQNIYNQRFEFFAKIYFPNFRTYEQYCAQTKKQGEEKSIDETLEEAKDYLMRGKQYLKNLEETPDSQRSKEFITN
jgi:hypothetical protein